MDESDPLDLLDASGNHAFGTNATTRTDWHGRIIDQVLRNRQPEQGESDPKEYYRLVTSYRADGAVTLASQCG